jgi:hypothetical protein
VDTIEAAMKRNANRALETIIVEKFLLFGRCLLDQLARLINEIRLPDQKVSVVSLDARSCVVAKQLRDHLAAWATKFAFFTDLHGSLPSNAHCAIQTLGLATRTMKPCLYPMVDDEFRFRTHMSSFASL